MTKQTEMARGKSQGINTTEHEDLQSFGTCGEVPGASEHWVSLKVQVAVLGGEEESNVALSVHFHEI